MGRNYKVISGDGHVETPPESWLRYLPEEHHERAPRLIKLPKGGEAWLIEGQPLIPNGQNITARGPVKVEGGSYFNAVLATRRAGCTFQEEPTHAPLPGRHQNVAVDGDDHVTLFLPVAIDGHELVGIFRISLSLHFCVDHVA